jgi:carbon-monoxide dehydrogenase small subunit
MRAAANGWTLTRSPRRTLGILLTMSEFVEDNRSPTERELRNALSGNRWRRTGYQNIVDAVLATAEVLGHRLNAA